MDIHSYKQKSLDIYLHLSTSKSMGFMDIHGHPKISIDVNGILRCQSHFHCNPYVAIHVNDFPWTLVKFTFVNFFICSQTRVSPKLCISQGSYLTKCMFRQTFQTHQCTFIKLMSQTIYVLKKSCSTKFMFRQPHDSPTSRFTNLRFYDMTSAEDRAEGRVGQLLANQKIL